MNKYFVYIFFCSIVILSSCRNGNKGQPDTSSIKLPYTSYPLYRDFSSLDTSRLKEGLTNLQSKYPQFFDFYLDTLVGFGFFRNYNDTNPMLRDFLSHRDYKGLQDSVNRMFPDTKAIDAQLLQSFKYIKFYDPTFKLPENIYYFVSGLNGMTAVFQNEKNIGVGLDMFLGRSFAPYRSIGIPDYGTIRMTPENIPAWVIKIIFEDRYPFQYEDKTLLDMMIQKGKELYFLKKVAPYLDESTVLGFTPGQLTWCKEHEDMIYNFFIQNNLLFDKSLQKTMRFVTDGPNTTGMPTDSPGNIGSFTGLRIVERYMEQHKISLPELLTTGDAQKILNGAKYKP